VDEKARFIDADVGKMLAEKSRGEAAAGGGGKKRLLDYPVVGRRGSGAETCAEKTLGFHFRATPQKSGNCSGGGPTQGGREGDSGPGVTN